MSQSSGNASGRDAGTARSPQRQRGHKRVASLLASAEAVFAEKGFQATTMTEVAARAQASIGTLYQFFPTKTVLAHTLMAELGKELSSSLDSLALTTNGQTAAVIADSLFDMLFNFMARHPVYPVLLDLPDHDEARARRRGQITQLFAAARPALQANRPDCLALIIPQLMRITLTLNAETRHLHDDIRRELRTMLQKHLT